MQTIFFSYQLPWLRRIFFVLLWWVGYRTVVDCHGPFLMILMLNSYNLYLLKTCCEGDWELWRSEDHALSGRLHHRRGAAGRHARQEWAAAFFLQKKTSLFLIQLIFKAQNGYRYLLDRQTKCTFPRFKNYLVYVLILIWLPQLFIIHIVWLFDVALCRRQAVTNSANTFYATKRLIGRRCFSVLMDLIWNAIRRFLCFCFDFQLKSVLI